MTRYLSDPANSPPEGEIIQIPMTARGYSEDFRLLSTDVAIPAINTMFGSRHLEIKPFRRIARNFGGCTPVLVAKLK